MIKNKFPGNLTLIIVIIGLTTLPLLFNQRADFTGADGQAEEIISQVSPGYQPWFANVWTPPSGEVESLLFSLQAAIGAAVIFYIIGYIRGRRTLKEAN